MYQNERLNSILEILKQYGYVTVKYLTSTLHYSNATINRDLNILQSRKQIHRTYGGVELIENKDVPLPFRYHKMRTEKLKIGKKAAEQVEDGDTVFLDQSTTTEYMTEFLAEKKDITVITNNMAIASRLSEYGKEVICLGGRIIEPPSMLGGADTVETAAKYRVDKMFFSTSYVSEDGKIGSAESFYLLQKTVAQNADKIYYLADRDKLESVHRTKRFVFDFEKVDCVISDHEFAKQTQEKYKTTQFIKV